MCRKWKIINAVLENISNYWELKLHILWFLSLLFFIIDLIASIWNLDLILWRLVFWICVYSCDFIYQGERLWYKSILFGSYLFFIWINDLEVDFYTIKWISGHLYSIGIAWKNQRYFDWACWALSKRHFAVFFSKDILKIQVTSTVHLVNIWHFVNLTFMMAQS